MKGAKSGGKPARVTPEIAEAVAEKLGLGLKLNHALAAVGNIPPAHWKQTLLARKDVANAFERKLALVIEELTARIRNHDGAGWQRLAWILERVHGYTTAAGPAVQLSITTISGVPDEVLRRARSFVRAKPIVEVGPPKKKLLPDAPDS